MEKRCEWDLDIIVSGEELSYQDVYFHNNDSCFEKWMNKYKIRKEK